MADESVSATTIIRASPEVIFAILADPSSRSPMTGPRSRDRSESTSGSRRSRQTTWTTPSPTSPTWPPLDKLGDLRTAQLLLKRYRASA